MRIRIKTLLFYPRPSAKSAVKAFAHPWRRSGNAWVVCGKAFTLVEMILVLVLIGILASSVVVSFEGRQETHALRSAAQDLAATIRFAVREAAVANQSHRVVFDDAMSSYWVETVAAGTKHEYKPVRGWAGQGRRLNEGVTLVGVSSDGMTVEARAEALEFLPGGSGFYGVIELKSRDDELVRIEVLEETGQVHVVE